MIDDNFQGRIQEFSIGGAKHGREAVIARACASRVVSEGGCAPPLKWETFEKWRPNWSHLVDRFVTIIVQSGRGVKFLF